MTIVGLSVSHTRALFTKSLAGTALQKVMIPIMNPIDLAKQFFPDNFAETTETVVDIPREVGRARKREKKN